MKLKKKQLDYRWIGVGILMMLGFSGLGYLFTLSLPYILNFKETEKIDCASLNETQWQNSIYHNQFKTLDSFRIGCKEMKHSLLVDNPKVIFIMLVFGSPIMTGFFLFKLFGIHKQVKE